MKALMVTSVLLALLLGRNWTNGEEPASMTAPSQNQTSEVQGTARAVSHPGQAEATVDSGPSDTKKQHQTDGNPPTECRATAVLGIIVQPVPAALAAHLPVLGEDQGWLVSDTFPESPLGGTHGLKLYDVIVAVDGQPIDTIRQLRRVLAMSLGINPISVEVIRAGKAKTIKLKVFPGSENVPRPDARPAAGKQSVSISFADRDLSLALASSDGMNYQLEVTYRDAHGQSVKQRLAGTSAHILDQADSLPVSVQYAVRRNMPVALDTEQLPVKGNALEAAQCGSSEPKSPQ